MSEIVGARVIFDGSQWHSEAGKFSRSLAQIKADAAAMEGGTRGGARSLDELKRSAGAVNLCDISFVLSGELRLRGEPAQVSASCGSTCGASLRTSIRRTSGRRRLPGSRGQ